VSAARVSPKPKPTHYVETRYGFEYGAVAVERFCSHRGGAVTIGLKTRHRVVEVYASASGRSVRVFVKRRTYLKGGAERWRLLGAKP
jgi:hypothetical protein